METDLQKAIIEKMQDEEFQTLDEIVRMGDTAVGLLRKILVEEKDPLIRQRAAVALGRIGAPESVQELRESLNDPVAPVVISALNALASMKAQGTEKDVERLLNSADTSVRRTAVKTLGSLGDPAAITALESVMGREGESDDVVAAAAQALRQLSDIAESR
jgi:HEAT repeat protein